MGCVLLSGKVEECPVRVRDVVMVFHHLYRRRRLGVGGCGSDGGGGSEQQRRRQPHRRHLTNEQKTNLLRYIQPMYPAGPIYKLWSEALLKAETSILRQLGFTLYWIPDHHPHKFILYFLRVLGLDKDGSKENGSGIGTSNISVAQRSWNHCNDSCLLDVCVRYEPEVIACASIILATSSAGGTNDAGTSLPMHPRPWWEVFIGPNRDEDLIAVCNAVLGLGDCTLASSRDAMRGYVPSLVEGGGSFTDPGSYLWNNCGINLEC